MSIEKKENLITKIENRMKHLINNQPHEHEWDCRIDQAEYFMLDALLDSLKEYDGIIEPISIEEAQMALKSVNEVMS